MCTPSSSPEGIGPVLGIERMQRESYEDRGSHGKKTILSNSGNLLKRDSPSLHMYPSQMEGPGPTSHRVTIACPQLF